ncbi:hypothetical protein HU200_064744 [Digitaria exilis]|uniref:HMA domain-containing protein n=1 Tax=Digitaria exilis TaxID=1010633 RepID=A0A835AB86_9POAL|nr:hypothetical protein HU200_064744 [Digitaria exilis]CAB3479360.1 unnamed protein product [Digitaria exilis]
MSLSPSPTVHDSTKHFPLPLDSSYLRLALMASEPIECQVVVLKVSIHCEGCKKKVKKVLQHINGVFRCEIDARSNKVMVTASAKLDPYVIVAKLRKSGKQAELWPEQPIQPPPPPSGESQSEEPKNQADEQSKPNEPAEKSGAENAEAGPSNPQPSPEPKQSTAGETAKPAQESKEANANAGGEAQAAAGDHPNESKGKAKQHPPEMEKKPVDARVTVEYDRGIAGGYGSHMPPPQHVVMSYNQARPSMSASYYAPAPAPAPAPAARPGPSQGYIDEHYRPSYYSRPSPPSYEPYYYNPPPQPSPYRYQYDQAAPSSDYYHYSAPPQRSAFSPPRDGYGDMFNDENANSCIVM